MSLPSVRRVYGVPAKRGTRIRYTGAADGVPREGVITSASSQYLRVHFDGESSLRRHTLHPTWNVEYLTPPAA
jgi:hypothetical protein